VFGLLLVNWLINVDPTSDRVKFSVLCLVFCKNVVLFLKNSNEVLGIGLQRECLEILLYDVDCVSLKPAVIKKPSVASNTVVGCCVCISRYTFIRDVLY
jgi:hypothetical protein